MTITLTIRSAAMAIMLLWAPIGQAESTTPNTRFVSEALLERELADRELALQLAPIKSAADLQNHLAAHANTRTPLSLLSKGARDRFLSSLVFSSAGLASFDYSDLRAELTASQIYRILELFGAQHSTKSIPGLRIVDDSDAAVMHRGNPIITPLNDYPDYRCSARATCEYSPNKICIGSNCMIP